MRKSIFKKVRARANQPFTWRIENARFPYSARMTWSRSTPGSRLILNTGVPFLPKVSLGEYDRSNKSYDVDLRDGSIIFIFPTDIVLTSPGNAFVLIELDCEFYDPEPELPVVPVDLSLFTQ